MIKAVIRVPLVNEKQAKVALEALGVDSEPPRSGVNRTLQVEEGEGVLVAEFAAERARSVRVAVNTFFDHLCLVVDTMDQFQGF